MTSYSQAQIIRIPLDIGEIPATTCNSEKSIESLYSLGERDKYINKMEEQIQEKRKLLMDRQSYLKKGIKYNKYLEVVKNDYDKYNNYIRKQKEETIKAMNIINSYIDDIKVSGKLTEENINDAKKEQQELTQEIDKIRKSLEEIIGNDA